MAMDAVQPTVDPVSKYEPHPPPQPSAAGAVKASNEPCPAAAATEPVAAPPAAMNTASSNPDPMFRRVVALSKGMAKGHMPGMGAAGAGSGFGSGGMGSGPCGSGGESQESQGVLSRKKLKSGNWKDIQEAMMGRSILQGKSTGLTAGSEGAEKLLPLLHVDPE